MLLFFAHMGIPGHNTFATITLPGDLAISDFHLVLTEAIRGQPYKTVDKCSLWHEERHQEVPWQEVNAQSAGTNGLLFAILWWKAELPDQLTVDYDEGAKCMRVSIDAYIALGGRTYSQTQDREHAQDLQATCLALYRRLNALEAKAENEDDLVLFHFSREEQKFLEDYPVTTA